MNSDQAISDYLARSSPYALTGLKPSGADSKGNLPITSHQANDRGGNPFHPDSPIFWIAILGAGVLVGIVGLTGGGRIGPVKAAFTAGKD